MAALLVALALVSDQGGPVLTQRAGTANHAVAESNICGQIGLAAAAEYVGRPDSLEPIFDHLPADGHPRTLNELRATARKVGLETRAVRWRHDSIPELPCPAIIRLSPDAGVGVGHFVLLLRISGKRVQVLDLPAPARWVALDDLRGVWDGVALYVARDEQSLPEGGPAIPNSFVTALAILLGLAALLAASMNPRPSRQPPGASAGRDSASTRLAALSAALAAVLTATALGSLSLQERAETPTSAFTVDPPARHVTASVSGPEQTVDPVTITYRVANLSATDARVEDYSTSCGCAQPTLSGRTIPAGGSIDVSIKLRPVPGSRRPFVIRLILGPPHDEVLELPGSVTAGPAL